MISFGGNTTPGGALISSITAMASPFVADGAIPVQLQMNFERSGELAQDLDVEAPSDTRKLDVSSLAGPANQVHGLVLTTPGNFDILFSRMEIEAEFTM